MLHQIELAESFIAGLDYETFSNDLLRLYAVTRCLEIISEASRRVPKEVKARHRSIPWRERAAAGNVYRHEYDQVAARRVWNTLQFALPHLRVVVKRELGEATPP
jgi:uncharacterized protein with HEPN domain